MSKSLERQNLNQIRATVEDFKTNVANLPIDKKGFFNIGSNGDILMVSSKYLIGELDQILDTKTIERTKYYIKRLVRSLSESKTSKINDLNLHRWKEYDDILTDSLWILDKRDISGAHNGGYWGNFIPQIPNQLLRRYTKNGEWVLDAFLGSGTTLIESKRLGRNGVGVELLRKVAQSAAKAIDQEDDLFSARTEIIVGDSSSIDFKAELKQRNIKSVQLLIMHPPYWDIIKFSENNKDLSNAKTIDEFLCLFGKIIDATYPVLDKGRYFAVVIGDKYSGGNWIPLGFYTMQEVLKRGYSLKSVIIKNFDETKGKRNQKELWRYRALVDGFYIFKHEYIFLFEKK
ncbi:MAG: DNA methyltransferase [Ignavibacteriales bacterium]|nr:DNA methyltransferase [Ignavibacteriales bacterium]